MIRQLVEEICIKKNISLDIEKIIYEYARLNLNDINHTAKIMNKCIESYDRHCLAYCYPEKEKRRIRNLLQFDYLNGFKSWVLKRIVFVNNHNRMIKLGVWGDYISI